MGKRSGSEKRVLADKITLRVDPELMSRIEYAAAKEGMSPASWLRLVAAAAAGDDVQAMPRKPTPKTRPRPPKPDFATAEVSHFFGELGRLGNNINQIAERVHQANKGGRITNETFTQVLPDLAAVQVLLKDVRADLRKGGGT